MEYLRPVNDSKPGHKNDNRRRTMEVSATMLRDILIGYNEDEARGNVSLEEHTPRILLKPNEQPYPQNKNREENASALRSNQQKMSVSSRNLNDLEQHGVQSIQTPIHRQHSYSPNSRQLSQDPNRFNLGGRRYSPPQGSTGSSVSRKSNSGDSAASDTSDSSPHTSWDSTEVNTKQPGESIPKPDLPPPPLINSPLNLAPPILTSSPLIKRKNHPERRLNLVMRRPPYYVGDTMLNTSSTSTNAGKVPENSTSPTTNQSNNNVSSSSAEIPYGEVFNPVSDPFGANSDFVEMSDATSLETFKRSCCSQERPSIEEHLFYDESLYRLLPEPDLARACPNPLYRAEEINSNLGTQMYYSNGDATPEDNEIAQREQAFHECLQDYFPEYNQHSYLRSFMAKCQRSEGVRSFTDVPNQTNIVRNDRSHSLVNYHGTPTYRYEHNMVANLHDGSELTGREEEKVNHSGETEVDSSSKPICDNFQQRIVACNPMLMHSNHRGRNEGEIHQFVSGKLL